MARVEAAQRPDTWRDEFLFSTLPREVVAELAAQFQPVQSVSFIKESSF
jgi:hypothetical protein